MENNPKYLSILKVLSVISAILTITLASFSTDFKAPFWLITCSYSALLFVISRYNQIYFAPGIFMLNITMFMRYCVLILSTYLFGELSIYANNYNYLTQATFLMIYEQVAIFIMLYVTAKFEKKQFSSLNIIGSELPFKLNNMLLVSVFILFIVVGVLVINPYLISGFSLITEGMIANENLVENNSGMIIILWQACLSWLYIFFCTYVRNKYKSGSLYFCILFSVIYILLTFIGQQSISRWYTIISVVSVYFILKKLYPNKVKTIMMTVIPPVLILLVLASIYKNTDYLTDREHFINNFINLFDSKKLDPYFSGPVGVNNALGLKNDLKLNISTLPLDVINNFPIINHLFDTSKNTVNQYNYYIGRFWNGSGDQIIPLLGQSMIYFSAVFSPLLSCLSIFLMRKYDRKYFTSSSLDVYLYSFASVWIAVMPILNLTIFLSWVYLRIFPLLLLITFTNILTTGKLVIRRRFD
ncbi:hypothetical protein [Streptococcus sp. E24BD]|uniref:hypothetical protein n=1 Tax=Streptococcus sp. E24BD TaxID=3278715 RepID=UPI00359D2F34